MDFDGDTGQGAEQQDLPPSDGPDGPERAQFDDNLDQKPPAPHRPVFPRINQSQYNSPRPSQPADLFRKQFHRNQVQPQQHNTPFFNLLNTINPRRADDTGSNRPRQSENSASQNVLKQVHSPAGSQSVLARGSSAYMSPRTPVLPPKRVANEEDFSREREMSATPAISSPDTDFDEFTVKMLKEKKALKVEILQAHNHAQELSRKVAILQDENANMSARNIESGRRVESLKAELTTVRDQLSSARSETLSIKATLESTQRDLASTRGDLISFRNQNLALVSTNQDLERYQGAVDAKLEVTHKALATLKNDYASLFTSFTDLKRLHDSATVVVADLSDGVAECRKFADDALRRVEATCQDPNAVAGTAQVRVVLDELRESLSESYRTNDLLRDKLHLHLGQVVELTDRVKELESERRDLLNQIVIRQEEQASNEKLGSKMEGLADRLVKREEEFEFVTADAVTLKAELRIAESRVTDLEREIADDAVKLQLLATAQDECKKAMVENVMVKTLLADKEDRIAAMEGLVFRITQQHNECRKQLESDLAMARSNAERRENEKVSLQVQLQNLQERVSESRDALSQLEANTEMIKVRAASEREEALKVFQGSITELKCSISAKTAEYNTVEASLKKTMQENADKETILKQKSVQFNILEERFEAQGATLRLAKEQCGDLQERLQTAERNLIDTANELRLEIAALQHQVETHQDAANELKTVKAVLAEKDLALTRTVKDLRDLQNRFDAQTKDLGTRSEVMAKDQALLSAEREKRKDLDKDFAVLKRQVAEKERMLAESENRTSVFQERLDAQKVALQMTREQVEVLQERIVRAESGHAGQLESVKEKLKAEIVIVQEQRAGLQACLNQARQDAVEQRALLDERLSRQEAASEKLLEAQRKRAEGAEDAAVQAKDHADMMKGELDDYLRTQKERQAQVELMDQELRDTRLRMQDALEKAQSAREQCELGDKERFASLDKISTLETQIVNLKEANLFLTNRSKTLQERYNNGDLTDQEKNFVHLIASIAQSAHENAHLEKTNELKRREAIINTLQERIKTLESTVARLLREQGEIRPEMKSLVNLNLWMSSSPPEGINAVDMQMPTVDPLQIKRTSAPMTPRDETPFAGRPIAETKKIDLIFSKNDSDSVKQAPTFSELSEIESEDDDVPLAAFARISPSPPPAVQGASKRGRASSPGPANAGRPNRRMRGSGTADVSRQAAKSPKASRKSAPNPRQKKQKMTK